MNTRMKNSKRKYLIFAALAQSMIGEDLNCIRMQHNNWTGEQQKSKRQSMIHLVHPLNVMSLTLFPLVEDIKTFEEQRRSSIPTLSSYMYSP